VSRVLHLKNNSRERDLKEDETPASSTRKDQKICVYILVGKLMGKGRLEDLGVDGISSRILSQDYVRSYVQLKVYQGAGIAHSV
jgi:hypothetical protein